jgi:alkylated DNA repair protein alkB homolog 7
MRVSTWDDEKDPVFNAALGRLETLCPIAGSTQTHVLHLASDGEIHPHIDNIDASGSWILGVSLGSGRVLRMESVKADSDCSPKHTFDVTLPSGSVYVQRWETRPHGGLVAHA